MTNVVLAVDVGYGNIKAAWGNKCTPQTEIIFKSIANKITHSTDEKPCTSLGRVPIDIDGDIYMIGPDSHLFSGSRILDVDYVARKEYLAFLRASMHFMFNQTGVFHKIDRLAVGLPVSSYASKKSELVRICKGVHEVPTPLALVKTLGATVKVAVESVIVIPQPFGALSVFASKCALLNRSGGATLIIDPGYKTLDWVFANGMNVDLERCGSFNGGVSTLLREVSSVVGKKLGVGFIDLIEVEEAINSGKIFADGRFYDFSPYLEFVKEAATQAIDKFFSALNVDREFTSIVLTGGGAKYYRDALAQKFPTHDIQFDEDAVMNNVRGFYLVAKGGMP